MIRHSLILSAVALCAPVCLTAPAVAQIPAIDSGDPVDFCRAETKGKKAQIACLEEVVVGLMGARAPVASDATVAPTGEVLAAPAVAQPAPVAPVPQTPAAQSTSSQTADAGPVGLGAEQVKARSRTDEQSRKEREDETVEAVIVEIAKNNAGRYVIILDNGQVWRQKSSDSARAVISKKLTYTATIKRGVVGGYRMKISRNSRPLSVERLK